MKISLQVYLENKAKDSDLAFPTSEKLVKDFFLLAR